MQKEKGYENRIFYTMEDTQETGLNLFIEIKFNFHFLLDLSKQHVSLEW